MTRRLSKTILYSIMALLISAGILLVGFSASMLLRGDDEIPLPKTEFSMTDEEVRQKTDGAIPADILNANYGARSVVIPELDLEMKWEPSQFEDVKGTKSLNLNPDPKIASRWSALDSFDKGNTVMAGHINGNFGVLGPMKKINDAKPGMIVVITDDEGTKRYYRTSALKSYLKTGLPETMFDKSEESRVHLVTCGGDVTWSEYQGYFAHTNNVVLSAVAI